MLQTIAARIMTLTTNVVISRWLLKREDFATAAMAFSLCTVFALFQPGNLSDILVQRHRQFQRWANSAFWLSVTAGLSILAIAGILAPIGRHIFNSPMIPWLILIQGTSMAIGGLNAVWSAEQSLRFNFRLVAAISTFVSLVASASTIFLAWLGCGPLSLALPSLLSSTLTIIILGSRSEFRPHFGISLARWRGLIRDAVLLSVAGFFSLVTMQADNFFLGLYRKNELGNYVWAYALSLQFVQLASGSLRGALLPAFTSINTDRQRSEAALRRAVSLVSLVTMPMCVLIVPAMPAVVRLVFSAKWDGAVPFVQIFLPSMGFVIVSTIFVTTMQSRGFYKRYVAACALLAFLFVASVWPSAAFGGPIAVAYVVSVIYAGGCFVILGISTYQTPLRDQLSLAIASIFPFVLAAISATFAWWVQVQVCSDPHDWKAGALAIGIGAPTFSVLALVLLKRDVKLLFDRALPVMIRSSKFLRRK